MTFFLEAIFGGFEVFVRVLRPTRPKVIRFIGLRKEQGDSFSSV